MAKGKRGRWQVVGKMGDTPVVLFRQGSHKVRLGRPVDATGDPLARAKVRRLRAERDDLREQALEIRQTFGVPVR